MGSTLLEEVDGRMRFRSPGMEVELDPAAGCVRVVERGKGWTAKLSNYTHVLLDLWEDRNGAFVVLYSPKGWSVDFGVAPSGAEAIELAGRLSTFLRLPVQHPVVY